MKGVRLTVVRYGVPLISFPLLAAVLLPIAFAIVGPLFPLASALVAVIVAWLFSILSERLGIGVEPFRDGLRLAAGVSLLLLGLLLVPAVIMAREEGSPNPLFAMLLLGGIIGLPVSFAWHLAVFYGAFRFRDSSQSIAKAAQ